MFTIRKVLNAALLSAGTILVSASGLWVPGVEAAQPANPVQVAGQVEANGPRPANPRDISGRWLRVTPFQTFGAVKGGANEYQAEILDAQVNNREPDLSPGKARIKGLVYNEPVFTPAGKAAFERNLPSYGLRIGPPSKGNDPQGNCDPWGVPRMLIGQVAGPHPTWDIIQTTDRVLWMTQYRHEFRTVWTDGRQLPSLDEVSPTWNGYSVGHWEGDTFVVNSIGFTDKTWLDHNGYPHTSEMKLQERYRLLDADTLEQRMTIEDPEYYAEPFVGAVKIWKRDPVSYKEWEEDAYCVASEEGRFNTLIRDGKIGQ